MNRLEAFLSRNTTRKIEIKPLYDATQFDASLALEDGTNLTGEGPSIDTALEQLSRRLAEHARRN